MNVRTKDPFEELLHRYRGLLFTLCSRFRHRGLDTDDLIQEATIALWRARERLLALSGAPQAALTWKIARNAVIDTGFVTLVGYSYKEIAQELEMTEKNVSVRLVRVKEILRKEMTK